MADSLESVDAEPDEVVGSLLVSQLLYKLELSHEVEVSADYNCQIHSKLACELSPYQKFERAGVVDCLELLLNFEEESTETQVVAQDVLKVLHSHLEHRHEGLRLLMTFRILLHGSDKRQYFCLGVVADWRVFESLEILA